MRKERIIITGSEGLIGSSLASYLEESYEIIKLSLRFGHDLTDEKFVKKWFSENNAEYLVNCFAINDHVTEGEKNNTLFNVALDSINKMLMVNVVALFSVCREFAKSDTARGIINFSSIYGLVSPNPGIYKDTEKHIGYSISKGAVIQLTRHLAIHLAPGIRVNCIAPGGIEFNQSEEFKRKYSEHTPLKRMMRRDELNNLVEYLCSEKSSYMTGSILTIDGGWTVW
ncbi:MAG TPA: SDR family oxidoreductase [Candidatus Methylomirabilis sp.]|nr:SDR family oxidoreductase [Candidatus Methylomirabilis sp.]